MCFYEVVSGGQAFHFKLCFIINDLAFSVPVIVWFV